MTNKISPTFAISFPWYLRAFLHDTNVNQQTSEIKRSMQFTVLQTMEYRRLGGLPGLAFARASNYVALNYTASIY